MEPYIVDRNERLTCLENCPRLRIEFHFHRPRVELRPYNSNSKPNLKAPYLRILPVVVRGSGSVAQLRFDL